MAYAESVTQVTEGSGKKLHTFQRTIGANVVEDEVVLQGIPYLASYHVFGTGLAIATSNDQVIQLMAGASLDVYVTRIYGTQGTNAGAAAISGFEIVRLSTAGTGGGSVTPTQVDASDAASGATAMTLPTTPGTTGSRLWRKRAIIRGAIPAVQELPLFDERWGPPALTKPIRIVAGTSNGICIRVLTGVATATVDVAVEFFEANFR